GLLDEGRGRGRLFTLGRLGSFGRLGSLDALGALHGDGSLGALHGDGSLGALGCFCSRGRLGTGFTGLALVGLAAPTARGDDPPGPDLARRLTHSHGRLALDLVFARDLVRQDVALVDPDLHADAPEGRARFAEAVVDVG